MSPPSPGTVYVTPIEPTVMERFGPLIILVVVSLVILWPTIYAVIKRRWVRALAYVCLTLPVIWITMNSHHWWGPTDPDNEFSPPKNALLYTVVTWPVLTAILWTITALSDTFLAHDRPRTRNE